MAALTLYIDDSGTHPESPVAVAAGWVSPVEQWRKFYRDWTRVKEEEGFTCFHSAECVASNARSQFANWDDAKKLRVFRKLRDIINRRAVQGFAIAVAKTDYDDLVTAQLRKQAGGFHYTWVVRGLIGKLEKWREQEHQGSQPVEYVFDRMSQGSKEINSIFENAEREQDSLHRFGIHRGCHSFRDKQEILPLQAADLAGWCVYQRSHVDLTGKPMHDLATESFNDFVNHKLDAGIVRREELAAWVERMRSAG